MSAYRDAVLDGTLEAEQLHQDLGTGALVQGQGAVDIFRVIDDRQIRLMFQKLGGLLGAYMRMERDGILVTTERTLAIQRFTAAHELGHAVLKHNTGIDDDQMLHRSPFGTSHYPPQEMAADTFAAMFLMPEHLIERVAVKRGWTANTIQLPDVVYQLSLRLGVSYEALVRTLARYKIHQASTTKRLLQIEVKQLKQALIGTTVTPKDWRCNIWDLTESDSDAVLLAEPQDFFVLRLRELSAAGYIWNLQQAREAGFNIITDERLIPDSSELGAAVERRVTAQNTSSGTHRIDAVQSRPWDAQDVAGEFHVQFDIARPAAGMTDRYRSFALAA